MTGSTIDHRRNRRFVPPTGQQIRSFLARYPARESSKWALWTPLVVLVVILIVSVVSTHPLAAVLPWLGVAGVLVTLARRATRIRRLQHRVLRTQELAMLRYWPQCLRMGWRTLPALESQPDLHARVVTAMAVSLDQVKAYEAAIEAYRFLIQELPSDQPGTVQLRVQCAIAELADGRLSDADDTLSRLRPALGKFPHTPISAGYHLARLIQQVRTNHWAEAAEGSTAMIDHLRPLGVDAGFGYALTALAYHRLEGGQGEPVDRPATKWWSYATTLLPRGVLIDRFPELEPLSAYGC